MNIDDPVDVLVWLLDQNFDKALFVPEPVIKAYHTLRTVRAVNQIYLRPYPITETYTPENINFDFETTTYNLAIDVLIPNPEILVDCRNELTRALNSVRKNPNPPGSAQDNYRKLIRREFKDISKEGNILHCVQEVDLVKDHEFITLGAIT